MNFPSACLVCFGLTLSACGLILDPRATSGDSSTDPDPGLTDLAKDGEGNGSTADGDALNFGGGALCEDDACLELVDQSDGRSMGAGGTFGCMLVAGSLRCWGHMLSDFVGVNGSCATWAVAPVDDEDDWVTIDAGMEHICGLRKDRSLWCFGEGEYGKSGLGSETNSLVPQHILPGGKFIQVSAGWDHSCAIREDHTLWCWGRPSAYDPEDTIFTISRPRPVTTRDDWVFVSSGLYSSCAISKDQDLYCWGEDVEGVLGDGEGNETRNLPTKIGTFAKWSQVAVSTHACARTVAGKVYCWGRGGDGQLGNGEKDSSSAPVEAELDAAAVEIEVGAHTTCARTEGGDTYCWGLGTRGRLGLPNAAYATPERIEGYTAQEISLGHRHSCLLDEDADLWCAGVNDFCQVNTARAPSQVINPHESISY